MRHSTRGTLRLGVVVTAALVLGACGGTPTAPDTPTPANTVQVAGTWSGTWTFNTAGTMVTDDLTMVLTQTGAAVTGTWTAASGATGQINFTATATPSGSLTINQILLGGGTCNATTTFQGTASTNSLDLTLANITPQGVCQWGTNGRFILAK